MYLYLSQVFHRIAGADDRPSAHNDIAIVDDNGLSRRNGVLRLIELHSYPSVLFCKDRRRSLLLIIAHSGGRPKLCRRLLACDPVEILRQKTLCIKMIPRC